MKIRISKNIFDNDYVQDLYSCYGGEFFDGKFKSGWIFSIRSFKRRKNWYHVSGIE